MSRRLPQTEALLLTDAMSIQRKPAVRAEPAPSAQLKAAFNRFICESDTSAKNQAGRDLISSSFGDDAIAEDPVR